MSFNPNNKTMWPVLPLSIWPGFHSYWATRAKMQVQFCWTLSMYALRHCVPLVTIMATCVLFLCIFCKFLVFCGNHFYNIFQDQKRTGSGEKAGSLNSEVGNARMYEVTHLLWGHQMSQRKKSEDISHPKKAQCSLNKQVLHPSSASSPPFLMFRNILKDY